MNSCGCGLRDIHRFFMLLYQLAKFTSLAALSLVLKLYYHSNIYTKNKASWFGQQTLDGKYDHCLIATNIERKHS